MVLQSVRAREEGRVPELGRPDTHKDPPSRASKAPPNRTELGYNRYDQERFSSTQGVVERPSLQPFVPLHCPSPLPLQMHWHLALK